MGFKRLANLLLELQRTLSLGDDLVACSSLQEKGDKDGEEKKPGEDEDGDGENDELEAEEDELGDDDYAQVLDAF